jgi:hypothetical protein
MHLCSRHRISVQLIICPAGGSPLPRASRPEQNYGIIE